jgi:hypothetical protein
MEGLFQKFLGLFRYKDGGVDVVRATETVWEYPGESCVEIIDGQNIDLAFPKIHLTADRAKEVRGYTKTEGRTRTRQFDRFNQRNILDEEKGKTAPQIESPGREIVSRGHTNNEMMKDGFE